MVCYVNDGSETIERGDALFLTWVSVKHALDVNSAKWEEKREKRAEAGRLGGLAKASKAKQSKANVANLAVPVPVPVPVPVSKTTMSGKPDNARAEQVDEIVSYLNAKTGKGFKPSTRATASHINARLNEGYTVDDFKRVIDTKVSQWMRKPSMAQYLRPETLFGSKFESYLNEKSTADDGFDAYA